MNRARALAVYKDIKKHWKNYDQEVYHGRNTEVGECLSVHCVAGFCELRMLKIKKRDNVEETPELTDAYITQKRAQEYLDLEDEEAGILFSGGSDWSFVSRVLRTGKFPKWVYGQ